MTESTTDEFKPPYVSWATFTNFLADKVDHETLPTQIDKSFLDSYSGSNQAMILNALKLFEMIDDDGTVRPSLRQAGGDEDFRREHVGKILRKRYSALIQLGEQNATAQKLHDWFAAFGYKGSTLGKAEAFYLSAAEYAGVPISPNFKVKAARSSGGSGRPNRSNRQQTPPPSDLPKVQERTAPRGEVKTVDLGPAGQVTVYVDVKWLELTTDKMMALREVLDGFDRLVPVALGPGEPSEPSDSSEML